MKKFLINAALVVALASMPLGLTGCKDKNESIDYSLSTNQFYAMGMATGANYLNNYNASGISPTNFTLDNSTKATLETYVGMFSGFMDLGIHPTKADTEDEMDGAYASNYEKKITLTLGNDTYVLYYNETIVYNNIEQDNDEIEETRETFLSGIAVSPSNTYFMVGGETIEIETEGNHTETEVEISMMLADQEITHSNNMRSIQIPAGARYVKVEEERESDEVEYKYTTSDSPQNPINIEWENENGKEELDVKIGNVEYQIRFSSINKFKVVEIRNGTKNTFYMEKLENGFEYTNVNGQII